MTDTAPPPAPAAPPAAPAPTLTPADIAAIAAAVSAQQPAPAGTVPASPAAPEVPTSPVNLFEAGQVVSYTYDSPYDGQVTRYGIVLEALPDEGAGARSVVAWFHDVSGPIGDHLLAAG